MSDEREAAAGAAEQSESNTPEAELTSAGAGTDGKAAGLTSRQDAFRWICVAYAAALVVALVAGASMSGSHPLLIALVADIAATIAIFGFSYAFGNSSFYDAYWSVAPVPLAIYWAVVAPPDASTLRQVVVIALILIWGVRLTTNWARGWSGLSHEDWRYEKFRDEFPRSYWAISFGGIHMMPTLWVFAGLLPVYAAVGVGTQPFGMIDLIAVAITGGAIWVEAQADRELRDFKASRPQRGELLVNGLWGLSRHPNYFGEMSFWWGLFIFAVAADPAYWWTGIGALSITLMFKFASLPMIEERMKARRPEYEAATQNTPLVIPWPRRRRDAKSAGTQS